MPPSPPVGSHDKGHVLDRDDHRDRPEHERDHPVDVPRGGVHRMMVSSEHGLQGIQRAPYRYRQTPPPALPARAPPSPSYPRRRFRPSAHRGTRRMPLRVSQALADPTSRRADPATHGPAPEPERHPPIGGKSEPAPTLSQRPARGRPYRRQLSLRTNATWPTVRLRSWVPRNARDVLATATLLYAHTPAARTERRSPAGSAPHRSAWSALDFADDNR
jgi:hypothetical protein